MLIACITRRSECAVHRAIGRDVSISCGMVWGSCAVRCTSSPYSSCMLALIVPVHPTF